MNLMRVSGGLRGPPITTTANYEERFQIQSRSLAYTRPMISTIPDLLPGLIQQRPTAPRVMSSPEPLVVLGQGPCGP
jgi:hypothetical protein